MMVAENRVGRGAKVGQVGLASGGQRKQLSALPLPPLTAYTGKGDAASCVPRSREAGVASRASEKAPPTVRNSRAALPQGRRPRAPLLTGLSPRCIPLRGRSAAPQAHALRPACRAKRSVLHLPQREAGGKAPVKPCPLLRLRKRPASDGPLCGASVGGGVFPRRSGCGATSPTNALCRIQRGRVHGFATCHSRIARGGTRGATWPQTRE